MSETTIERILAAREQAHLDAEAYALRLGLSLGGRWYCRHCHRHHECWSAIASRHEQFGDPLAIRAVKRVRFMVLPGAAP